MIIKAEVGGDTEPTLANEKAVWFCSITWLSIAAGRFHVEHLRDNGVINSMNEIESSPTVFAFLSTGPRQA